MNKQELLNLIRNKLTLPRTLLEMQSEESSDHQNAVEAIDTLIQEINNSEITNQ